MESSLTETSVYENGKAAFTNSSGLKNVCWKLGFQSGLVWTVGVAEKIKLHFQILLL